MRKLAVSALGAGLLAASAISASAVPLPPIVFAGTATAPLWAEILPPLGFIAIFAGAAHDAAVAPKSPTRVGYVCPVGYEWAQFANNCWPTMAYSNELSAQAVAAKSSWTAQAIAPIPIR